MAEQYSMEEYAQVLCAAVEAYNYPAVTYNFERGVNTCTDKERKMCHPSMCEVEGIIKSQLLSKDIEKVKDGLSNVLYWGMYRMGVRDTRVCKFRKGVTTHQLNRFKDVVDSLTGTGLAAIRGRVNNAEDNLPQFTQMPFVSKIRMFLDPENYPVLDKKIATFAKSPCFPPLQNLSWGESETTIRISGPNERVYGKWAKWCRDVAGQVNSYSDSHFKDLRAVDVERAIFQLSQSDESEAWWLLQGPKTEN